MTSAEGKNLLQECLEKCGITDTVDSVFYYKRGRAKQASEYHHDTIPTDLTGVKILASVKYVVKCFYHIEVYVAWEVGADLGTGKYECYKKDLVEMESHPEKIIKGVNITGNKKAYFFRGREGVTRFIHEYLI